MRIDRLCDLAALCCARSAARGAALSHLELLSKAVLSGRIAVPATPQELARFDPPPPEALGLPLARRP